MVYGDLHFRNQRRISLGSIGKLVEYEKERFSPSLLREKLQSTIPTVEPCSRRQREKLRNLDTEISQVIRVSLLLSREEKRRLVLGEMSWRRLSGPMMLMSSRWWWCMDDVVWARRPC